MQVGVWQKNLATKNSSTEVKQIPKENDIPVGLANQFLLEMLIPLFIVLFRPTHGIIVIFNFQRLFC